MFSRGDGGNQGDEEDSESGERRRANSRARSARYRARNRAAIRAKNCARAKKRYHEDPEYRRRQRELTRIRLYGISPDDYDRLLARQQGACAICKRKSDAVLCVDHCHSTGKVRGLVCRRCNTGLGCYEDNLDLMRAAMAYLVRSRGDA